MTECQDLSPDTPSPFPVLPGGPDPNHEPNRLADGTVDLLDPGVAYTGPAEEFTEPIASAADQVHPWIVLAAALVAFDGGQSAGPVEAVRLLEEASKALYAAREALTRHLARALADDGGGLPGAGRDLATYRLAEAIVRAHKAWDAREDETVDHLVTSVTVGLRDAFSAEGRVW